MTADNADSVTTVSVPKVLGVTPEAFYAGWISWAKQTQC